MNTRSRKTVLLLIIECIVTCSLSAQNLTVRITDTKEEPIPNATVFIRETTHGIVVDERGEFQTKIDAGNYTLDISSLGYERKTMTVSIPPEGLNLRVQLTEKVYALREVVVTPGKEDPAFRVMRNVIARAPYHFHQVKSYESDIYFKGAFIVDKIPKLIQSQIDEPEIKNLIGKRLVYESQNEVKYAEPDKYEQRVIALSTTIPKSISFDDQISLSAIMMNIYSPTAAGGLMGQGSFSVYKFKLEDTYRDGDHLIYKIRVIPRKNSPQLVNGELYIVDNTWTVQRAGLTLSQAGVTVQLNRSYHEVKPGAFLVSACDMNISMSLMGIKGNGQLYASIKYNNLETNDHLIAAKTDITGAPGAISAPPTKAPEKILSKKQQQNQQKIEELASKETLTTREAYKLAQLVEKTVESDEVKEQKQSLEIRPMSSSIKVARDSLALMRDSSFWNAVRILPLKDDELLSYLQRDSLRLVADSMRNNTRGKRSSVKVTGSDVESRTDDSPNKKLINRLVFGDKISLGKKFYIQPNGLLFACSEYNFVDGFRIGQRIETGIQFDKHRSFSITPAVYYTTARKQADFIVDGTLIYAPMRRGRFSVSTGNTIADHAGRNGTGRFGNTLGSILFAGNTAKFYQKRFVSVSNVIDPANGLILTTGFNYEKRNDLENNTSFNILNKQPATNRPYKQVGPDELNGLMPTHESYTLNIAVEYTPRYYYRVWDGQKHYVRSAYPTLGLRYNRGFSMGSSINSSFENIEASLQHTIKLNLFNHLFYGAGAGAFLSAKQTYLADYKHFQTNEMFLTGKSFNTSFTMDNYRFATNEKWMQGFVTYHSQYLLLKQLPFLQRYLFDEAIHLKTLWTPEVNHNEAGYSIGLGGLGRIGVFFCFRNTSYDSMGFVLTLPFLNSIVK